MAKDLSDEDLRRWRREREEENRQFFAELREELAKLQIVLDFLRSLRRR